ncbi:hypothetical protein [Labedaea rhizosphaerae]|uniref:Uncharacterized protein n=1 Tax=Labedaea rhizosphaerae TaxID=598644 RepID=A0A4R6S342_LABRH|nr:hypothetical protein [Labedaea rhizosphaerae]TDP94030.1 hypothetical protein EV186_106424 [Labedaea rhizosphaerae]
MSRPTVNAYVKIPAGCDISYSFGADGDIEVLFGSVREGFEVILTPEALAKLAAVIHQALHVPADLYREPAGTPAPAAVV